MDNKDYVNFFRQTSPYIHDHRGKTFVIGISGEAIIEPNFRNMIHDIALLQSLGIHVVVVHGARAQINQRLASSNIISKFEQNIRITDEESMRCIKEVVGSTRLSIESELSMAMPNSPMYGSRVSTIGGNFVTAQPFGIQDGIDFQWAGEVRRVDKFAIDNHLKSGSIVLISPLGFSPTGEIFNLNYHEVTTTIAIELNADKVIFISRPTGLLDQEKLLRALSLSQLSELQETAKKHQQLELLDAAEMACHGGIEKVHLVGYAEDGALLSELFTRDGSGTLISRECENIIRLATIDDVGGILNLITPLENQGFLVKRSRELLETEITRFTVVVHPEGFIIGCAALYPTSDESIGELACVAVHDDFHDQGIGARLLTQIEDYARGSNMDVLIAMTTKTAHWFVERGFVEVSISDLPDNKQEMYNFQRNARIFEKQFNP
jgi:amino-acid N-acetyltransferase